MLVYSGYYYYSVYYKNPLRLDYDQQLLFPISIRRVTYTIHANNHYQRYIIHQLFPIELLFLIYHR